MLGSIVRDSTAAVVVDDDGSPKPKTVFIFRDEYWMIVVVVRMPTFDAKRIKTGSTTHALAGEEDVVLALSMCSDDFELCLDSLDLALSMCTRFKSDDVLISPHPLKGLYLEKKVVLAYPPDNRSCQFICNFLTITVSTKGQRSWKTADELRNVLLSEFDTYQCYRKQEVLLYCATYFQLPTLVFGNYKEFITSLVNTYIEVGVVPAV
jgi:hypothetical protein